MDALTFSRPWLITHPQKTPATLAARPLARPVVPPPAAKKQAQATNATQVMRVSSTLA